MGELWPTLTITFLLLGSISGQRPLTVLGLLLLLAGLIARLWSRWVLERVEFRRELAGNRAFQGETVQMTVRIANRKLLPLHWLRLYNEFPIEMRVRGEILEAAPAPGRVYLIQTISLAWYEQVAWRFEIECTQRGYYRIGPARARSADLFGFFPRERVFPGHEWLVVYPRTVEVRSPVLPLRRPFGEVRSLERIYEDPSRVMGLRDYRPEDPLKRVDWKATARRGALTVRVYEPTVSLHLLLALNINTMEHAWEGYLPDLLDLVITGAASLARHGSEQGWAVGLLANGSYPLTDTPIRLMPGRDAKQLLQILEALAVISPMATLPVEAMLREERRRIPLGATVGVITAVATAPLWQAMEEMVTDGHQVMLFWGGDTRPPPLSPAIHQTHLRDVLKL